MSRTQEGGKKEKFKSSICPRNSRSCPKKGGGKWGGESGSGTGREDIAGDACSKKGEVRAGRDKQRKSILVWFPPPPQTQRVEKKKGAFFSKEKAAAILKEEKEEEREVRRLAQPARQCRKKKRILPGTNHPSMKGEKGGGATKNARRVFEPL